MLLYVLYVVVDSNTGAVVVCGCGAVWRDLIGQIPVGTWYTYTSSLTS